jgi:hypothetical protein
VTTSGWFWAALCALSVAIPAHANDTAFRGAPADLVLQKGLPIVMKSEDIALTATSDMHWNVVAKYVFENDSDTTHQVQVGFPELRCWNDDEYPCGKSRQFQGLETFVDGKQVSLARGKLAKRAEWAAYLGTIWLFNAEFPARGTVQVEHRYRVVSSEYSNGMRFVDYVIRTGSTWKSSIGSARFTVRVPPYSLCVHSTLVPGLTMGQPRVVDGPNPYVEFVVEGQNLEPHKDVMFGFRASSDYDLAVPLGIDLNRGAYKDLTADRAIETLALIHAARGYPFRSRALRERFYGKGEATFRLAKDSGPESPTFERAARGFSAFDRSWFLREDLEMTKILEARLTELGAAFDAPDPPAEPAPAPSASPLPPASVSTSATAPPSSPAAAPPATRGCRCEAPGLSQSGSGRGMWLAAGASLVALRRRTNRKSAAANRS